MMSLKILVTYASRMGSTVGVAEEVGKIFAAKGAEVTLCPMVEVTDLTPYDAVVAGSAIQNRQWLPEAMQFLHTHQSALRKRPFATFTLCMTLALRDGEKYRPRIAEWVAPVRRLVHPISEGLFAGVLNIRKVPSLRDRLKFRLSVLFGVWTEGDHRDWNAIRAWASELYPQLTQVGAYG